MSNKKFLTALGILLALAIVSSIVYYLQNRNQWPNTNTALQDSDTAAVEDLNALLYEGNGIPDIQTPTTNPLDKVAPSENPIDKTNPFASDVYQNPFE
jgi:hypothetical protein